MLTYIVRRWVFTIKCNHHLVNGVITYILYKKHTHSCYDQTISIPFAPLSCRNKPASTQSFVPITSILIYRALYVQFSCKYAENNTEGIIQHQLSSFVANNDTVQ